MKRRGELRRCLGRSRINPEIVVLAPDTRRVRLRELAAEVVGYCG